MYLMYGLAGLVGLYIVVEGVRDIVEVLKK
jgi:hypothetical protein